MAKSIVMTYILSSLPALALLVGQLLAHYFENKPTQPNGLTPAEHNRITVVLRWMPFLLAFACLASLVYTLILPSRLSVPTTVLVGSALTIAALVVVSFLAFRSQNPKAKRLQIGLLALFPVLGVTIFYLFFSTALAYKKSMKPLLVALAKVRPNFATQPTLFFETAPVFSWFYYGQEALVNKQLALEKQGLAQPMILPEYDATYPFPSDTSIFKQPIVVIINKAVAPSLLNQQKKHPELLFAPLVSQGYYAAYLVQQK
jgi:hypothetical protein